MDFLNNLYKALLINDIHLPTEMKLKYRKFHAYLKDMGKTVRMYGILKHHVFFCETK